jgi:uncharacterized protein
MKSRKDLASLTTGLYSRELDHYRHGEMPEEFALIQALVLLNVVSGKTFIERGAENLHLDPEKATLRLDERVRRADGLSPRRGNPMPYAKHVKGHSG